MDRGQIAIDKLNAWYEQQTKESIQDYIKGDGDLNKGQIARDAGFGRKALMDRMNGNSRLQARYEKIFKQMSDKKWLTIERNSGDNTSGGGTDLDKQRLEKKLEQAQNRVADLESKLAKANVKIAQTESQFSQLSEMREVMIELGYPTR